MVREDFGMGLVSMYIIFLYSAPFSVRRIPFFEMETSSSSSSILSMVLMLPSPTPHAVASFFLPTGTNSSREIIAFQRL